MCTDDDDDDGGGGGGGGSGGGECVREKLLGNYQLNIQRWSW